MDRASIVCPRCGDDFSILSALLHYCSVRQLHPGRKPGLWEAARASRLFLTLSQLLGRISCRFELATFFLDGTEYLTGQNTSREQLRGRSSLSQGCVAIGAGGSLLTLGSETGSRVSWQEQGLLLSSSSTLQPCVGQVGLVSRGPVISKTPPDGDRLNT